MAKKISARFTVFEVINERRNEVYVGATNKQIFDVLAALDHPKGPLEGWSRQSVRLVSLSFGLTRAEAAAFIARHVARGLPRGWRYLT